ncbi:OLC1v1028752C1 [Oldenlandia corymbosa var. corymbosa]|uniref:OLC1v1028752C1 n=1 Tax=Oldenlandia corymbosa var. corymbosa TaxID=529605 RepID=A0AAV1CE63_OLDCO|nr:OLC1v1028752C1 [Oldenlandia corymbosa var. corymbosa]
MKAFAGILRGNVNPRKRTREQTQKKEKKRTGERISRDLPLISTEKSPDLPDGIWIYDPVIAGEEDVKIGVATKIGIEIPPISSSPSSSFERLNDKRKPYTTAETAARAAAKRAKRLATAAEKAAAKEAAAKAEAAAEEAAAEEAAEAKWEAMEAKWEAMDEEAAAMGESTDEETAAMGEISGIELAQSLAAIKEKREAAGDRRDAIQPHSESEKESPSTDEDEPFDAVRMWKKQSPRPPGKPLTLVQRWGRWKEYYKMVHETQGFGVTWAPDSSFKSKFRPYEYTKMKTITPEMANIFKDRNTIIAKLQGMAQKCIKFYNQNHKDGQQFKFDVGNEVGNVAYTPYSDASLFFITFTASLASPDDGSSKKTFYGQYCVFHWPEGDELEDPDRDETGGGASYCMMKDDFDNSWNPRKPCSLSCCTRYNFYPVRSVTYRDWVSQRWKAHQQEETAWEHKAPGWLAGELLGQGKSHGCTGPASESCLESCVGMDAS